MPRHPLGAHDEYFFRLAGSQEGIRGLQRVQETRAGGIEVERGAAGAQPLGYGAGEGGGDVVAAYGGAEDKTDIPDIRARLFKRVPRRLGRVGP